MLNGNIDLIDRLSRMSESDLIIVAAFAKFKMYLTENYGKKIDLLTISAFSNLIEEVFSDEEE